MVGSLVDEVSETVGGESIGVGRDWVEHMRTWTEQSSLGHHAWEFR